MPEDEAAGVADRVAQRHRPEVLDGEHEGRAPGGQLVEQPHCQRRRAFDELPNAARPIVGNTTAAHITQI